MAVTVALQCFLMESVLCSGDITLSWRRCSDHQAAGGGSVCRPPPQRPVRDRAARVTADRRRLRETARVPQRIQKCVCVFVRERERVCVCVVWCERERVCGVCVRR